MSVNEKMTAIADAIRSKTNITDMLTLDDMAQHAGREWVYGTFANVPTGEYQIKVFSNIEHFTRFWPAPRQVAEDSTVLVEKYSYIILPYEYNWQIEPAENLTAGPNSITAGLYFVKGDFTVTCLGKKQASITLGRESTFIDEWGELRPPIIAKIYGCTTYDAWVGICDADTTEYTYDKVHDHWGYVQFGGDGTGGVYDRLETNVIPPDGSTVIISRGNLCRNGNSVLTRGNYKLVLFKTSLFDTDVYEAIAEAYFTLM